jgi:intracellular sulfur oxidation DsrE/DsrF family protein
MGPIIKDYGPTYPINNRDVALLDGTVYRAVFDIGEYSDDYSSINNRLVSVARYLNMHARNGVSVDDMHLAIVVHGGAVKNLMNDAAYEKRFGSSNPNLDLLLELNDAGVDVYLCGQSMTFGGVEKAELAGPVKVALSAMTMLTVLQSDGYALLP